MKKALLILLALAMVVAFAAGCAQDPATDDPNAENETLTLTVGETYQLEAQVAPETATNQSVGWKTNKKKVAQVSSTGLITAKKVGTAKITCTAKGNTKVKVVCKVTVVAASDSSEDKRSSAPIGAIEERVSNFVQEETPSGAVSTDTAADSASQGLSGIQVSGEDVAAAQAAGADAAAAGADATSDGAQKSGSDIAAADSASTGS